MMPNPSSLSSDVDVLIVGAGPAGLALANWFRSSKISVRLVDKKPEPTKRGQAEGLKSTTVEILESFGLGPQFWAEAWRLEEIAIWGPQQHEDVISDGKASEQSKMVPGIQREQVMQDKVPELGKTRETMLQQSRVEDLLLENLSAHENIRVQRSSRPTKFGANHDIMQNAQSHPWTVTIATQPTPEVNGTATNGATTNASELHEIIEEVRARYVVGCDGAHSWTRSQMGVTLEGDLTDSVFGVVDIVPKTNFPDIRRVCYLRASTGTILLVPRSNREVRLYVPVETGGALSDPKELTFDRIMDAARTIILPYTLEVARCSWWSAYRVGQRVGDHFSLYDRAFLAGDAVHTHSPKAGQGMNTSIQDAYNLGWKLRLVLEGNAHPSILQTYESERRPVAQDLISFDRGYLKLFSAPSKSFEGPFLHAMRFTTGLSTRYPPSAVVQMPSTASYPELAAKVQGPSILKADVIPGKRLPDFQVVYQADGRTTYMHSRLLITQAKFHVIVFAGDISSPDRFGTVQQLGSYLNATNPSGLRALTEGGDAARVEVLLVHCAERDKIELLDLEEIYRPWSDDSGWNYERVFADVDSAHEGHGHAYERLEIDKEKGCVVIVRPDAYIGAVMNLDDFESIDSYFKAIETGNP